MQETQEMWVRSLGQEDPLEEEVATHSSILARGNLMDRGAWRPTVHGVTKRRAWQSTYARPFMWCKQQTFRESLFHPRHLQIWGGRTILNLQTLANIAVMDIKQKPPDLEGEINSQS